MYFKETKRIKGGSIIFMEFFLKTLTFLCIIFTFTPVDLSCHLVLFPYCKIASFSPTPFVLFSSNILHFHMLKAQQNNFTNIVLSNCFLIQLRDEKKINM